MNKIIGLLFSLLFVVAACFLGVLGSIHGARLFPYFVLCLLVLLLVVWWWLCFFLPARKVRHASAVLLLCGVVLGFLLLAGISAGQRPLVDWEVRQMQKRAAAIQVADMRDEPLLWRENAPIGIRLHYSLRFPDSDYFWQSPFLYPATDLGYTVGWNIVHENTEPPLQVIKHGSDLVPIETAHLPPDVRRYEQSKVYNFTIDLVPDFLAVSADGNEVCIVRSPAQFAAGFAMLLSRGDSSFYTVTISSTNYHASTQNSYNLKNFYDTAIKNGAADCKYRDGRISFQ